MKSIIVFILIVSISCISCKKDFPESFKKPLKTVELPHQLNEVSGLARYSSKELILVNDEQGIIYFFDLEQEKVNRTLEFKKKGDFEGVTVVGKTIYVLESKGTLYRIEDKEVISFDLFQGDYNLEGLCYHEQRNSLLIACKEHAKKEKEDHILVFEYDLSKKELLAQPFLNLNRTEVSNDFKPSGIALNSKGNLFITSAVSESIIEVDKESKVLNEYDLPKENYPQVEGIVFDELGHLLLVSEKAGMRNALLYKINLNK